MTGALQNGPANQPPSYDEAKRTLDVAAHALQTSGPAKYWQALTKATDFAELPLSVVEDMGYWGQIANFHLLETAKKFGSYHLVAQNLHQIQFEIAALDLAARRQNLAMGRSIRLTSEQVEGYHHEVFEQYGLPQSAFTGTAIKAIVDDCWSAISGHNLIDAQECHQAFALGKVGWLYFQWDLHTQFEIDLLDDEERSFIDEHGHLLLEFDRRYEGYGGKFVFFIEQMGWTWPWEW